MLKHCIISCVDAGECILLLWGSGEKEEEGAYSFEIICFMCAQMFSIGFRSGEFGGC